MPDVENIGPCDCCGCDTPTCGCVTLQKPKRNLYVSYPDATCFCFFPAAHPINCYNLAGSGFPTKGWSSRYKADGTFYASNEFSPEDTCPGDWFLTEGMTCSDNGFGQFTGPFELSVGLFHKRGAGFDGIAGIPLGGAIHAPGPYTCDPMSLTFPAVRLKVISPFDTSAFFPLDRIQGLTAAGCPPILDVVGGYYYIPLGDVLVTE